ncbi:hypothetical protein PIB30_061143 [Stylosanthes scabra]|uniref:Uncharacterized protein n=1 Tax=Stylosanthes scabra TaxID=79078 RepID=A0ABU6TMY9_9FABA|nr:hypothetical protein [Stylosanthes scabra]
MEDTGEVTDGFRGGGYRRILRGSYRQILLALLHYRRIVKSLAKSAGNNKIQHAVSLSGFHLPADCCTSSKSAVSNPTLTSYLSAPSPSSTFHRSSKEYPPSSVVNSTAEACVFAVVSNRPAVVLNQKQKEATSAASNRRRSYLGNSHKTAQRCC